MKSLHKFQWLIAISESAIRQNNVKQTGLSEKETLRQYSSIIQASPYLLDINEINKTFTEYHENQKNFKKIISSKPKAAFSIDNHTVYYIKHNHRIEFYIFDDNVLKYASCILYCFVINENWSRNGLFKTSAKGWFVSHAWKAYTSKIQSNITIRFLRKLVAHLKYDYIVTDAAQTAAMNKIFIQFAKSYIDSDCVYAAVSNRPSRKAAALIENYKQLTEAMKLISTANASDMYKSIVIFNQKLSTSSMHKIFHDDVKELTYAYAKKLGYFTDRTLDNKDELIKHGYIKQDELDLSL